MQQAHLLRQFGQGNEIRQQTEPTVLRIIYCLGYITAVSHFSLNRKEFAILTAGLHSRQLAT